MKYQMAKILLYQYLYRIRDTADVSVTCSGGDAGWLVRITGDAPNIKDVCSEARIRADGYLRTTDGHLITVDRYSTADVVKALFDRLVDGEWEDVA